MSNITTDKIFISQQTLEITGTTAQYLTVPDKANYAIIRFEADSSAVDKTKIVRTILGGDAVVATTISATEGMPFGDLETVEINERSNLESFRVLAIVNTDTSIATIWYFE